MLKSFEWSWFNTARFTRLTFWEARGRTLDKPGISAYANEMKFRMVLTSWLQLNFRMGRWFFRNKKTLFLHFARSGMQLLCTRITSSSVLEAISEITRSYRTCWALSKLYIQVPFFLRFAKYLWYRKQKKISHKKNTCTTFKTWLSDVRIHIFNVFGKAGSFNGHYCCSTLEPQKLKLMSFPIFFHEPRTQTSEHQPAFYTTTTTTTTELN